MSNIPFRLSLLSTYNFPHTYTYRKTIRNLKIRGVTSRTLIITNEKQWEFQITYTYIHSTIYSYKGILCSYRKSLKTMTVMDKSVHNVLGWKTTKTKDRSNQWKKKRLCVCRGRNGKDITPVTGSFCFSSSFIVSEFSTTKKHLFFNRLP